MSYVSPLRPDGETIGWMTPHADITDQADHAFSSPAALSALLLYWNWTICNFSFL